MPAEHYDPSTRQRMSEIAVSAAIGAALMLFVGFVINYHVSQPSTLYDYSVGWFTGMMRVGGALMGAVAVALWMGVRPALLIDAALTILIGVAMIAIGGLWLGNQDYEGLLLLIFGAVAVNSGWGSWVAYRGVGVVPRLEPEEVEAGSSSTPADPAGRRAAMERLLAAKQRERKSEPAAEGKPGLQRVRESEPAPVWQPAVRPQPVPEPERRPPPEPPAAVAAPQAPASDEPPPEGFLAQLGKKDS